MGTYLIDIEGLDRLIKVTSEGEAGLSLSFWVAPASSGFWSA